MMAESSLRCGIRTGGEAGQHERECEANNNWRLANGRGVGGADIGRAGCAGAAIATATAIAAGSASAAGATTAAGTASNGAAASAGGEHRFGPAWEPGRGAGRYCRRLSANRYGPECEQ